MNNLKMVFAIMAIVFMGIIALPYAASLFAGQHAWYDLEPYGSQVPCEKCHADVSEEIAITGAHKDFPCENCHRTDADVGSYARGVDPDGGGPGSGAHAASTEDCMICHDFECDGNYTHVYIAAADCRACHPMTDPRLYPPTAGGFSLTNAPNDSGIKAAHKAFVLGSKGENSTLLEGANEACISCHTKMPVKIGFTVTTEAKITVNNMYSQSHSYWDVESITPGNYMTYEEVKE
jgi:hypothetical protein